MPGSISAFAAVADEFRARVERTVWATMATADARGRPRARIVHPIWEGPVGWLLTGRHSPKGRHLDRTPFASLTYWDQANEQVHVECATRWEDRPEERRRVWDVFRDTPPPVGYDPGLFFTGGPDDRACGVLRLDPWRLELWSLADLVEGRPPRVWTPR
jgi:hypothetical protein